MKQYVKVQKNKNIVLIFMGIIMLSVFLCLACVIEVKSISSIIISCTILSMIISILLILILIGKISRVKIDMNGIWVKENRKVIFVSWEEFIDCKFKILSMRTGIYKIKLITNEKSIYIYNDYLTIDKLIEYCSFTEFLEKLKKEKVKVKKEYTL